MDRPKADQASVNRLALQEGVVAKKGKRSSPSSTRTAVLRCECGHSKSIHARMYANQKLGTPCNYPECRCKAYRKM